MTITAELFSTHITFLNGVLLLSSIAVSSDSKELYAGYSSQQIVGWVKPKSSNVSEEGEYEHAHAGMEAYYGGTCT